MNNPIISVIIPSYQQGRYLKEAVDSVIAQTLFDWEIIIVDDGSTDDTQRIANALALGDSRIQYVYQNNSGPAAARNKGISLSKGKFILPLDADDKIDKLYLEKAVSFLQENEEFSVFYGAAEFFGDKQGPWNVHYCGYKNLLLYNQIYISCVYRKKDWERVGGYDETFKWGAEDMEFNIRLLYHNDKVYQDSQVLFYYRKDYSRKSVTTVGINHSGDIDRMMLLKHYDKYVEYYGSPFDNMKELLALREWLSHKLPRLLRLAMVWRQKIHNKLFRI